ncbi:SAM-dependent methyltransferase [Spirochaeta dissipatitropha]
MNLEKTSNLDSGFIYNNLMGPNSVRIISELLETVALKPGMKVLDLGCGKGLTSIFLAQKFGVQVFAVDLWIPAAENFERFRMQGLDTRIIPIQADAMALPFAEQYFDAMISVDAYHYFGSNESYFDAHLSKHLKPGAPIAIAVPGMKHEVHSNIPPEMKAFWPEEALATWQTAAWWQSTLEKSNQLEISWIQEMQCFNQAWADWLETGNEYAIEDRGMIAADKGRYMNLLAIHGTLAKDRTPT